MKVEVTLQFDVPDDSDIDVVAPLLRERIKDFDYYNELVQTAFITKPERSILYKENRLEHLERVVSGLQELILEDKDKRSTEANDFLYSHDRFFREKVKNEELEKYKEGWNR